MTHPHLGIPVDSAPRPFPPRTVHRGLAVSLELLDVAQAMELWEAAQGAEASWTYLRYGPFPDAGSLARRVEKLAQRAGQPFWAVRPVSSGKAEGWLSLCDIYPADAAIEIGSIWFSPGLQRTRAATEAVFLLMRHAFDDLGYRRLVWRCQALNRASARAAERYGFRPEGVWRAGAVVKGWQRDVAWFAMLSDEWPARRAALEAWLADDNFGPDGRALRPLGRA
jgi:RimJ/RimL family protein N-acetyltransferase